MYQGRHRSRVSLFSARAVLALEVGANVGLVHPDRFRLPLDEEVGLVGVMGRGSIEGGASVLVNAARAEVSVFVPRDQMEETVACAPMDLAVLEAFQRALVIDEAAYCPEAAWTEALRPSLAEREGWAHDHNQPLPPSEPPPYPRKMPRRPQQ